MTTMILLLLLFLSVSLLNFQIQVDAFVPWQAAKNGGSRSTQVEKSWRQQRRRREHEFLRNNNIRVTKDFQNQLKLLLNPNSNNAIIQRRRKGRRRRITIVASSSSSSPGEEINECFSQVGDKGSNDSEGRKRRDTSKKSFVAILYSIAGIATFMSWIATSIVALSFHPDPKFKDCTLRHNILTISQAFAFPLPITYASFRTLYMCAKRNDLDSTVARRLNLGVAVFSAWLMAAFSPLFSTNFAFGYDLYPMKLKIVATIIHGFTAFLALTMAVLWSPAFTSTLSSLPSVISGMVRGVIDSLWKVGPSNNNRNKQSYSNSPLYATGTIGLLWFTILPIVSPYPLATIPTILGKRLSRPASAFTLLGAIIAYCMKEQEDDNSTTAVLQTSHRSSVQDTLRMGLLRGSGAHLALVFLKLIGVDGGGWIFPGNGLQEVYPAMISVPFATGVSLATHGILCFAASITPTPNNKNIDK